MPEAPAAAPQRTTQHAAADSPTSSLFEQLKVGETLPVAVEPASLVIFGGAGDLAHRKLLPALYNLHLDGLLPPRTAIVGVGRKPMTDDQYREFAKDGITQFSRRPLDERAWETFAPSSRRRSTTTRRWRRSVRGSTSSSTSVDCRAIASTTSPCRRRSSCRR